MEGARQNQIPKVELEGLTLNHTTNYLWPRRTRGLAFIVITLSVQDYLLI